MELKTERGNQQVAAADLPGPNLPPGDECIWLAVENKQVNPW